MPRALLDSRITLSEQRSQPTSTPVPDHAWEARFRRRLRRGNTTARLIAGVLACGGAFWGLLLLPALGLGLPIMAMLGPGYLLTAGYFVRAFSEPTYEKRLVIWLASISIQGTWLIVALARFGLNPLALLWWGPAVIVSVVAAVLDGDETE